ncbi:homeobox-leucine zipper protein HDG12-like [Impatiens glandulifera]|uniref:homeobox-leucine zipper protein HDG12-like n=1 Tax=Impatiens glandulifera TaxID=253017 RepID=UPI001FB0ADBC|nr:homeobox-leucine zipper protein HDG12-like [Impatiens glandulifera]
MTSNRKEADVPESSRIRRSNSLSSYRSNYRHSPYQIQMLEVFFNQHQHPSEQDCCRIGKELGLTPNQVKSWFQNKKTALKEKNKKKHSLTLREENQVLQAENLSMQRSHVYSCSDCKDLTPIEVEQLVNVRQLQTQNLQLRQKYFDACISIKGMGIHVPINQDLLPPMMQSNGAFIGQSSMEPVNHIVANAPIVANGNLIAVNTNMNQHLDFEMLNMTETVRLARDELMCLLHLNEPFWVKDVSDGRCIINREIYEVTLMNRNIRKNHRNNGLRTRIESSKYEASLNMSAFRVAQMLTDSKMRVEYLFPTIITNAFTIHDYGNQVLPHQVGPLKLEYEQIQLSTASMVPRDFYFVRFCEKVTEGTWLIVEVSHDFNNTNFQLDSPCRAWRRPSGCIIKDVSPGVSQVTWIEHVEIDQDKDPIHLLYKDVIFGGLAFHADRWVQILSRSFHGIDSYNNILKKQFDHGSQQNLGVLGAMAQEEIQCIMRISNKMVRRFCANMSKRDKLEMPDLKDKGICLSLIRDQENTNPSNSMIINAATSFRLDASCKMILDYLQNVNMRTQWDVICYGQPVQETACIKFGDQLDSSISIIKPNIESQNTVRVIQETLVDPLGAVVVYAPMDRDDFNGELYGSWPKTILPSGFLISKDGNPECMRMDFGGASTSRNVAPTNGSLVTVAFQVMCYSKNIEPESVEMVTSLISSAVDSIKLAFKCPDPSE